jgi:hypothetical protein
LIASAPAIASIASSGRPQVTPKAKTAEGRVGFERRPDLLEEGVEGSVARRRIALLDVDLDLDRMLVVRAPEAAERLLRLARIAIAQDDEATDRDLLGQHAVTLDDGQGPSQAPRRYRATLGLAGRHGSPARSCSISAGSSATITGRCATSSRLQPPVARAGTSTVVRPWLLRRARSVAPKPRPSV